MIQKIKFKIKWLLLDIFGYRKIDEDTERFKGQVRVLCFHGICKDSQDYINARFLKVSVFESLLKALKTRCNFITLEEYLTSNIDEARLNILVTFDDGYRNNLELALPICKSLNIPFVLFLTNRRTGFWMDFLDIALANKLDLSNLYQFYPKLEPLNNSKKKLWINNQKTSVVSDITKILNSTCAPILNKNKVFWELLNEDDLRILANEKLVSLANHSANHYNFLLLEENEILFELKSVEKMLLDYESKFSKIFAYPYNLYDTRTVKILKKTGYEVQFLADGNLNKENDRLVINPFISESNQLKAIFHGRY